MGNFHVIVCTLELTFFIQHDNFHDQSVFEQVSLLNILVYERQLRDNAVQRT